MAKNDDPRRAMVDEGAKRQAEAVAETERMTSQSQPTPTQRENDLAKVGALDIDDKEDDGSGPDPFSAEAETVEGGDAPRQKRAYRTRVSQAE